MTVWGVRLSASAEPSGSDGDWLRRRCEGVVEPRLGSDPDDADRLSGVIAGLAELPASATVLVLVDDDGAGADRGTLVDGMLARCEEGAAAAVVGAPVTDALKRVAGGDVVGGVERDGLLAPRTPQVLRREALEAALAAGPATPYGDPAALLAQGGWPVEVVRDPVAGGVHEPAPQPAGTADGEGGSR